MGDPPIIVAGSSGHKDGEIVRPLPDGSAPDPPEGFTIVVKDNGLMVLRKRRYRDLKKVGIGGFLAKTRTTRSSTDATRCWSCPWPSTQPAAHGLNLDKRKLLRGFTTSKGPADRRATCTEIPKKWFPSSSAWRRSGRTAKTLCRARRPSTGR